jgi:hypothetical protein
LATIILSIGLALVHSGWSIGDPTAAVSSLVIMGPVTCIPWCGDAVETAH